MKTITKSVILVLTIFITAFQAKAQFTASEALDEVIISTDIITSSTNSALMSQRTLVISYFLNNDPNPNTEDFLEDVLQELEVIEEYSDEVNYYANYAQNLNSNINVSNITSLASQIEANGDYIEVDSQSFVNAINNNDRTAATTFNNSIRTRLNLIISLVDQIKIATEELKEVVKVYNVRIELVEQRSGNSIDPNTLPGYTARNLETNEYIYAGDNQGDPINIFYNLPTGTYRFDARDGYFDGASSTTITLSNDLVGTDGFVVVTLNYWSE